MKNLRRSLIALLLLLATNLYAQKWYVCVGSFRSDKNADQRVAQLESYDIPACIAEFKKSETDILYRILVDIPFNTLDEAHKKIAELNKNPGIKKLGITGLWAVQAENTRKTAAVAPAPVPAPAPVVEEPKVEVVNTPKIETKPEAKYIPEPVPEPAVEEEEINEYKIVLEWNNKELDLDSHIICKTNHVYYGNTEEANLSLDVDDTKDYSPEVITIKDPDVKDFYQYYVYNFSDDYPLDNTLLSESGAKVKLYYSNELQYEYEIKPNQKGILWHVFDIEDDMIVDIDEVEIGCLSAKPDSSGNFELIGTNYDAEDDE